MRKLKRLKKSIAERISVWLAMECSERRSGAVFTVPKLLILLMSAGLAQLQRQGACGYTAECQLPPACCIIYAAGSARLVRDPCSEGIV